MLVLKLGGEELFNEETNTFEYTKPQTVRLAHSLLSISKWEEIHEKPFIPSPLSKNNHKTDYELRSYFSCMVIGELDEVTLDVLWFKHRTTIEEYIAAPHTATTIHRSKTASGRKQTVTSELIYYWMIAFNIPFECERWHLNRLLTLIDVCYIKQASDNKKMSQKEILARNRNLNQQRRAQIGSKG